MQMRHSAAEAPELDTGLHAGGSSRCRQSGTVAVVAACVVTTATMGARAMPGSPPASVPRAEVPTTSAGSYFAPDRMRARLAVLEQEAELVQSSRSREDERAATVAAAFAVKWPTALPANGTFSVEIAQSSPDSGYCAQPNVTSTFLATWSRADRPADRVGATLTTGCPVAGSPVRAIFRLPPPGRTRYLLCVKLELFNTATQHLATAGQCSRFAFLSGRDVHCINASARAPVPQSNAAVRNAAVRNGDLGIAPCTYTGFTPGVWTPKYNHFMPVGCAPPTKAAPPAAMPGMRRSVRWLRAIGDSVPASMWGGINRAPFDGSGTRSKTMKLPNVDWTMWPMCKCGKPAAHSYPDLLCITLERWFDHGASLSIPARGSRHLLECMASLLDAQGISRSDVVAGFDEGRASHVLVGLGAHNPIANDDERSRARYTTGFVAWLRQQRAGVRVILSLEPAIDRSVVPKKYRDFAQECRSSNVWQQRRNQAAIDTLTAACAQSPVRPSCKVLDLFTLSLPLLFDDRFYAMGDPVHVFTRCKSPVSQDCAFIATLLRNVLWAFEKDHEKD